MLSPQIGALMQGLNDGKNALAGVLPSAQNAQGQPAVSDPAGPEFDELLRMCNQVSAKLADLGNEQDAHQVAQCALKLQSISLARKKRFMQESMNGGGGAMSKVGPVSAFGVPQ